MPKSNVSDILAAQRAVQALDKKGRLAILNDLKKQDLTPRMKDVVTYEKGVEK